MKPCQGESEHFCGKTLRIRSKKPLLKNSSESQRSCNTKDDEVDDVEIMAADNCSTPKTERFRIAEINITCPPAPKKIPRRIIVRNITSLKKRGGGGPAVPLISTSSISLYVVSQLDQYQL